jgi:hypothetical protein
MNFAKDSGVGWRKEIKEKAKKRGLKIKFLDPTDKPKSPIANDDCIHDEKDIIAKFRKTENWESVTKIVKRFRRIDLRMVDRADFIIIFVDTDIHMTGSYDEATTCEKEKKPVLAIVKQGREGAPDWLFGIVNYWEMFKTVDECLEYLDGLNSGKVAMDGRWVIFSED